MKKFILLSFLFSVFSIQALLSQTYVSTNPQVKNVILAEFSGVHCPNCSQGHQCATQILTNNPGRVWANYTNHFLTEASAVNVGLATTYDEITKQLDILMEIYYTANMTDQNTLNVLFTESGLIAQQSGGSTNYVHNHIFRETFTAQWGDPITESTTQGSFIQKSFTFDNSEDEYNMDECEIVAYIVNAETTEVI